MTCTPILLLVAVLDQLPAGAGGASSRERRGVSRAFSATFKVTMIVAHQGGDGLSTQLAQLLVGLAVVVVVASDHISAAGSGIDTAAADQAAVLCACGCCPLP